MRSKYKIYSIKSRAIFSYSYFISKAAKLIAKKTGLINKTQRVRVTKGLNYYKMNFSNFHSTPNCQ